MLTIWGRLNSVNVQKVVFCAEELQLDYERIEAGLQHGVVGASSYRAMNPNGLVPTIREGDFTLWESNAIVRYLAARYGSGMLRPASHKNLAMAEQWMEWTQQVFSPAVGAIFTNTVRMAPEMRNPDAVAAATKQAGEAAKIADQWLSRHDWFAGTEFSFGDIAMGALMWRYLGLDCARPETPLLAEWMEALQARDAFRRAVMDVPRARTLAEWNRIEKETA